MRINIEYAARQDHHYDKAFKPLVFLNGKAIYTTTRCKKTMRGALNCAKRIANEVSKQYPKQYNEVVITQRTLE